MKCPVCGKEYKKKFYFDKHVAVHAPVVSPQQPPEVQQPGTSTNEITPALFKLIDDDDLVTYFELEDEEEEARRVTSDTGISKEQKKAAFMKCADCSSTFQTLQSYVKHRAGYGMKAAYMKLPAKETTFKESWRLATEILEEMQSSPLQGGFAPDIARITSVILDIIKIEALEIQCKGVSESLQFICDELYAVFEVKRDFLFPSDMAVEFYKGCSVFLSDQYKRSALLNILGKMHETNAQIYNIFIGTFVNKFSNKMLAYLLHYIRTETSNEEETGLKNRFATTKQSTDSLDFIQNMHFVGGSNVKSVLTTALRFHKTNEECERVNETIRMNFLITDMSNVPNEELMQWTMAIDRGKLTKINNAALEFFVTLGKEVKPLERLDGSLLNEDVYDVVAKSSQLLSVWSDLKGTLSDSESFEFLHALVSHFCVTWRNGIAS